MRAEIMPILVIDTDPATLYYSKLLYGQTGPIMRAEIMQILVIDTDSATLYYSKVLYACTLSFHTLLHAVDTASPDAFCLSTFLVCQAVSSCGGT